MGVYPDRDYREVEADVITRVAAGGIAPSDVDVNIQVVRRWPAEQSEWMGLTDEDPRHRSYSLPVALEGYPATPKARDMDLALTQLQATIQRQRDFFPGNDDNLARTILACIEEYGR